MRWRSRRGSQIVEFALVLPLLMILVFGIVDFSIGLYDKAVVTNASREGARAGIIMKTPRLTSEEIQDVVWNYCTGHMITFGATAFQKSDIVVVGAQGASGADLEVTVTYPFEFVVISTLVPSLGTPTLQAKTVMKME
jgi:Flp pilus assembly protein TadG